MPTPSASKLDTVGTLLWGSRYKATLANKMGVHKTMVRYWLRKPPADEHALWYVLGEELKMRKAQLAMASKILAGA